MKLKICCETCEWYDPTEDPEGLFLDEPCIACTRNPNFEDKYKQNQALLE